MQPASASAHGVLPRYIDLAHRCREQVVDDFCKSFWEFLEELPDILLELADQAESNVFQAHCMDVRQEVHDHREEMAQRFYNKLMAGFERFILGQEIALETDDATGSSGRQKRLSLVEKETFEIELAFDTIRAVPASISASPCSPSTSVWRSSTADSSLGNAARHCPAAPSISAMPIAARSQRFRFRSIPGSRSA